MQNTCSTIQGYIEPFLPIKGQKIDLISFLNALNEAEVLNSVVKNSIISLLKEKMTV